MQSTSDISLIGLIEFTGNTKVMTGLAFD